MKRHDRAGCLSRGPCVQECIDSCCFVLELVGVCRASEKGGKHCLNKTEPSYSWSVYYLQVCAACPAVLFATVCCLPNCIICKCVLPAQLPVLFRKFRTPPSREQHPWYVPYRDLAGYNRSDDGHNPKADSFSKSYAIIKALFCPHPWVDGSTGSRLRVLKVSRSHSDTPHR
jgi:hypothetical protein